MKFIDVENWNRKQAYQWFSTFSNSTYGCNKLMDVTNLVQHSKNTKTSFFANMLYLVVTALNSIEEMRTRLVDGRPCILDDINPSFTVMTVDGVFANARHKNHKNYATFYRVAREQLERTKNHQVDNENSYNPTNCWDEYYITCLPWLEFSALTHPIPDSVESQCVPRICWGKFYLENGRYKIMLNITVSHILVDGYPLSQAFLKIQENLDNADALLR